MREYPGNGLGEDEDQQRAEFVCKFGGGVDLLDDAEEVGRLDDYRRSVFV